MTGRRLGIHSDARYRFERGVDPTTVLPALEAATRLILELCGGEASEPVVAGAEPEWRRTIEFRPERVAELGGVPVPADECRRILRALGFSLTGGDTGLAVSPPPWRPDVAGEADLVEEVLRIHGYERIPALPLDRGTALPRPALTPGQARAVRARRALAARGLVEAVTFSFMRSADAAAFGATADAELTVANPISADLDRMRPSILPNLVTAARRNRDRGLADAGLFEIGPQYADRTAAGQRLVAAGLRWGQAAPRHWAQPARSVDVFDAKADALAALEAAGAPVAGLQISPEAPGWYHPGRSGSLRLGPSLLAWFGELHPRVLRAMELGCAAVGFEAFLDAVPKPRPRAGKAKPALRLSPFQPVGRDFAFVLDRDVPAEAVVKAVRGADKTLIADVAVFDLYAGAGLGEGRKSLAVEVMLQPVEATLAEAEIEAVSRRIVEAVAAATGGTLRG